MKARHKRAGGGEAGTGVRDKIGMADDESPKTSYSGKSNVTEEADERKKGGRAKRKRGGEVKVHGASAPMRADRKPRKSGGSADANPLSSANKGSEPGKPQHY